MLLMGFVLWNDGTKFYDRMVNGHGMSVLEAAQKDAQAQQQQQPQNK